MMISISKIDDKLTIFKDKKIILFGAGRDGKFVKKTLKSQGFKIAYFCDSDRSKWGKELEGIAIISPDRLCQIYDEKSVIQISSRDFGTEIEKQLKSLGMEYITFEEYIVRITYLSKYKMLQQSIQGYEELLSVPSYYMNGLRKKYLDYAVKAKFFGYDNYNILCSPPKTGNCTLKASIQKCGGEYVDFEHSFKRMFKQLEELLQGINLRIVTAVRDPIAQNISLFFELNTLFCDVPEYWNNGGDVQRLFDSWISSELGNEFQLTRKSISDRHLITSKCLEYEKKLTGFSYNIQNYFEENINIVYDHPFDKKAGYSIIKSGNMEVFLYQLERLNDIKDKLGEFLGIEDFELVNDNEAAQKWYAPVYRQTLKELKLSREYFEYCYNSKYVKHFYSEEDIGRFRENWSNNIDE